MALAKADGTQNVRPVVPRGADGGHGVSPVWSVARVRRCEGAEPADFPVCGLEAVPEVGVLLAELRRMVGYSRSSGNRYVAKRCGRRPV